MTDFIVVGAVLPHGHSLSLLYINEIIYMEMFRPPGMIKDVSVDILMRGAVRPGKPLIKKMRGVFMEQNIKASRHKIRLPM